MIGHIDPIYRRIMIKVSGEVLQGTENFGIDFTILDRVASEVKELVNIGVQVGIIIGGGNLFRGSKLVQSSNMCRIIGDHIGMLATIINGLAMLNALNQIYVCSYLMSSVSLKGICDHYNWIKAIELLSDNKVVILGAGIGNPLFTTDSAACLRGIEIKADAVLKGTKVDGVFSKDPIRYPNKAILYEQLSYQDVLSQELKVMDLAAFTLARDHNLPLHIFNINRIGALKRIIMGYKEGTLITE